MIRSIYFSPDAPPQQDLAIEQIQRVLDQKTGLLWVSLENTNDTEIEQILSRTFHFHPLTIEDCLSQGYQTPKVDDFSSYIFIIMNAILPSQEFSSLDTVELDLYLGSNFLVTCYTEEYVPPIQSVWQRLTRDERLYRNGADTLCHAVLDALVDDYMPLLDQMDEEIEWLEDSVLSRPNPATLERLLTLKHAVMSLRRILAPQREVINRLARDEYPQIQSQSRIYFRDIYDHLVRILDLTESIRDIVSGAMDIYLNSTSLRLNEVMKALTIVSTIFLPLTFVAGIYGMNFHFMPELSWKLGYPMVWVVCVLIVLGMLYFFKSRKWF